MIRLLREWWKRSALNEPKSMLYKKLKDHRFFTAHVFLFGGFLGVLLWIWDYITDPEGAQETIVYRLFFLILISGYVVIRQVKNPYLLAWFSLFLVLITLTDYIMILTYLHDGMLYGIAGFMFYMLLPPIAFQAFPLWINIVSILLVAAFPQLLAWAGVIHGFQQANYAVLIWPAAFIATVIQYFYALEYHRRYHLEKALEKLSYTDMLSGLYNRRYFIETFNYMLSRSKLSKLPLILMIGDIDRFKSINDQYGHPAGDEAIKTISSVIQEKVGVKGIAARIGGEEFGILLPDTDAKQALKIAEEIRAAIAQQVITLPADTHFSCTISIGIAVSKSESTVSTLFKEADQSLYKVKHAGRNGVGKIAT